MRLAPRPIWKREPAAGALPRASARRGNSSLELSPRRGSLRTPPGCRRILRKTRPESAKLSKEILSCRFDKTFARGFVRGIGIAQCEDVSSCAGSGALWCRSAQGTRTRRICGAPCSSPWAGRVSAQQNGRRNRPARPWHARPRASGCSQLRSLFWSHLCVNASRSAIRGRDV